MTTVTRKQLLRFGNDPVLKMVCVPVAPGEPLADLMDLMQRAIKQGSNGVGLAAPQVGISKRVIFTKCRDWRGTVRGRFFINPEIFELSVRTEVEKEGCLSFPGVYKAVRRPVQIILRYEDERRFVRTQGFLDFHARVIQHEIDHLNGICKVGDPTYPADKKTDAERAGGAVALAMVTATALTIGAQ